MTRREMFTKSFALNWQACCIIGAIGAAGWTGRDTVSAWMELPAKVERQGDALVAVQKEVRDLSRLEADVEQLLCIERAELLDKTQAQVFAECGL